MKSSFLWSLISAVIVIAIIVGIFNWLGIDLNIRQWVQDGIENVKWFFGQLKGVGN